MLLQFHIMVVDHQKEEEYKIIKFKERGVMITWQDIKMNNVVYAVEIGVDPVDRDIIDLALQVLADAKARGVNLMLPVDTVVAPEFSADAEYKTVPSDAIPAG